MNISLNAVDYSSLSPLLILLCTGLILLIVESFHEKNAKQYSFYIAFLGLFGALVGAYYAPNSENPLLNNWIRYDSLARFFNLFFISVGLLSALLTSSFFDQFDATEGEFYFLLVSSVFGLILIGASADFLTLFLGLETLSISLYILCGYMKKWTISHESAIKYFFMGAIAAAILLYGIALIYGAVGTTNLYALADGYKNISNPSNSTLFFVGIAFVTIGLAFKAAIVPFHTWAPDVYYGAPTPVTAFMAVGTKVGAFAAFAIIFLKMIPQFNPLWHDVVAFLAYPTLIYANIVALKQTQLRRFFAYSGISHAGFLLIPLAVGTPEALTALLFYFVVYALATFGSFAVLAFIDHTEEGATFDQLRGLFKRSPILAGCFSICLLTLAGIPPTAGFFAKFFVFKIAFQAGYYGLVIVALLTTILAVYYYLRIIGIMFSDSPVKLETLPKRPGAVLVGCLTVFCILILTIYPTGLLDYFSKM